MAASASAAFQLYMRIVEAKGLKGVEKNGTSDPFVKIKIDGQQTNLETKVVLKSTNPIWHQEFVMSVPKADSSIELKVYDWNRIQSNELLGTARLNLAEHQLGKFEAVNLNLDTQGQILVMILVEPYPAPLAKPVKERMSQKRIQLENSAYYPGSTLRGVAVYSTRKPVQVHGLSLTLCGYSWVYWCSGGKHKVHYHSSQIYFNHTVPLIGAIGDAAKKTQVDLAPGVYLFPFEYVLPMELPPSFIHPSSSRDPIEYKAVFHADVKGKSNKTTDIAFRVLPNHKLMRPEQIGTEMLGMKGAFGKDEPIKLLIHGPATAFTGEPYKLHYKIDNTLGKKAIESVSVLLRKKDWFCGKIHGSGRMVRHWPIKSLIQDWKVNTQVAAGTSWEGDLEIQIPAGLTTSLHSTLCPNIQNAYYFKLKVATSGNVFSKASGDSRYNFLMADNNRDFEGLTCPAEPEGPLNQIWTAPAPPNIFSMLPPAATKDGSIVYCGRAIGPVGQMPGAHQLPSMSLIEKVPLLSHISVIKPDEWSPGVTPKWVTEEGLNPEESFDVGGVNQAP